jgi:hypothetical protein
MKAGALSANRFSDFNQLLVGRLVVVAAKLLFHRDVEHWELLVFFHTV